MLYSGDIYEQGIERQRMSDSPLALAKITWKHPQTGVVQEFVLTEGATATIGRQAGNDICIPEQHVSRQHAVINYRDGIFMITDLGSANGTLVNNVMIYEKGRPLRDGDILTFGATIVLFRAG